MKSVKKLDARYMFAGELDASDLKVALGLNLVGLALLFLFGWIFLRAVVALRPEIDSPNLFGLFSELELIGLVLGLIGVLILHELVHGLFFWIYTHERPKFGFSVVYAYAAAPDWYLPRNQFLVVGLAPFVAISLLGLIILPLVPFQLVSILFVALTFNAAGSVGDLAVASWLIFQPPSLMLRDEGPKMNYYKLTSPSLSIMSQRWLALMESLGVDQDQARRVFADLVSHYTESSRYYHDLGHVEVLLGTVNDLAPLAQDLTTIQLAVWFHDVIYDAQADDNETKSAEYAQKILIELGVSTQIADRVHELIMCTITHQAPAGDVDAQILLDADLAPLASDELLFLEQSEALRKEFSWLPEREYKESRVHLLNSFLNRERIYQTEQLYDELESKARRNISQAITALT